MDLGTVSGRGGSGLLSPACIEPVLALICQCRTPIPQANDTCVIFTGTPFVLTQVQQANIFFLSLYSNPHLLYVAGLTRHIYVNHSLRGPTQAQDIPASAATSAGYHSFGHWRCQSYTYFWSKMRTGGEEVCTFLRVTPVEGYPRNTSLLSLQCLPRHESIGTFS